MTCRKGHDAGFYANGKCKECSRLSGIAWRAANPGYSGRKAKEWKAARPGYAAKYQEDYVKKRRQKDPFYTQLKQIRLKCKKAGLDFDLTQDAIISLYDADPICPITGCTMLIGEGPIMDRMTIDRLDPTGGYTMSNINLLSHRANVLKGNNTDPELFAKMAEWLREKMK